MKKATIFMLVLMLVSLASFAYADTWYCPKCGRKNDGNYCPVDGQSNPLSSYSGSSSNNINGSSASSYQPTEEWGLATTKIATRSGPSTEYTEPGTFKVSGNYLKIVSIAYDENALPWVQCEISSNGGTMRVYTGLKRFDTSTFDLSNVTNESTYWSYAAQVSSAYELRYGPGNEYALMSGYKLNSGKSVVVITTEGSWAQVQFTTSKGYLCRGWIPTDYLR